MDATGIKSYFQFQNVDWQAMRSATWETIWMTVVAAILVVIIGLLLGLLLYQTRNSQNGLLRILNWIVSLLVNVFRSIPFIILIVLLLPVTKDIIGTIIGPKAAIPSLVISAAPFYARMVEANLRDIDSGVIEAVTTMGASNWEVVTKVLLPESKPALIAGATVTTISLISYSAMAGAIGAGGLGNLAYLDGFQSNNNTVTLVATVIIACIVFIVQFIGDRWVKAIDKRTI
ncbi:metal ion ABC superfamily ATP binding cassette transporter, membrane protein [Lentilactobacillus senioris DSM 24302 = JCM 17472]|uniref:Metal ion ABC superfamily ATP binding cassette transporter, membrane protein n=2 Tax=Lentilactobacillus senioris TaxID=931534 RepID=A0A0R2CQU6_9LACO|nr:methionine ABC transporter permease [Lentilactobacillus senioris]KRM93642.1 metal ion ABC superfamily ATP binding cassette transporter, membrane protein [Lentilactobacillus senioris DSM 24302 = JCM 17472]